MKVLFKDSIALKIRTLLTGNRQPVRKESSFDEEDECTLGEHSKVEMVCTELTVSTSRGKTSFMLTEITTNVITAGNSSHSVIYDHSFMATHSVF